MRSTGGYTNELFAAFPDYWIDQLEHARLAYDTAPVPTPGGGFPAWEFTTSMPSRKPSGALADPTATAETAAAAASAATSEAPPTLRVVGRSRLARSGEEEYSAVVEIAFRGSKNLDNWLTNFAADLTQSSVGGHIGQVHRGWQEAYLSLRDVMFAMVADGLDSLGLAADRHVLACVTGHSLGGALATLAAYDISVSLGFEVCCVTWASPRVGDAQFAEAYASAVSRTTRFVQKLDVVPRLPVNPSDSYDDGPVLGTWFRAAVSALFMGPGQALGVAGYHHVCRGTLLDPHINHSDLARAAVSGMAERKGITRIVKEFHSIEQHAQNLERLLAGDVERATRSVVPGDRTFAGAPRGLSPADAAAAATTAATAVATAALAGAAAAATGAGVVTRSASATLSRWASPSTRYRAQALHREGSGLRLGPSA